MSYARSGTVACLLVETFYRQNHERKQKIWSIALAEIWYFAVYKWKVHYGKIVIISDVVTYRSKPVLAVILIYFAIDIIRFICALGRIFVITQ